MPSVSEKQRKFMAAVAHNPSFAKKAGVPQSVGKEFNEADKGRKFGKGGDTMATKNLKAIFAGKETKAEEKAERKATGGSKTAYKRAEKMYEGETMKKGGMTRGKKFGSGGMPMSQSNVPTAPGGGGPSNEAAANRMRADALARRAMAGGPGVRLAKGGTASARADGIAQRGKTKGKLLCGGGMTKKR